MLRRVMLIAAVLLFAGCSTLKVGDISYNSIMSTTDTLSVSRPDGSKVELKGKVTIDPRILNSLLVR